MSNHSLRLICLALALLLTTVSAACALPSPVPVEDGAAAAASVASTAGTNPSANADSYAVNVTDMAGNAIQLSTAVSSIVVLDPADCELLYALGAGDMVVGRTSECDYPDAVNLIPFVTVEGKTDPDLVVMRAPQVVILSAEQAQDTALLSALGGAGILPVVTNATDINSLYSAITLLGAVTNHVSEANTLISSTITSLAELQKKITPHEETVYLELSPPANGLTTAGGNTFASSLIALLGFHNEFEDQSGLLAITQDQVIGRSPDYILTTAAAASVRTAEETATPDETPAPESTPAPENTPAPDGTVPDGATPAAPVTGVDEILARADWQSIDAVAAKRVYYLDARLLTRAGPRVLDALNALYAILYEGKQP
ncbi:MAG: ABC transporter substrate-binding protein [Eubacteriales bacterium]|nr:ABC transporter substrate-binding protein [Eubacteriales bacterium]